MRNLLMAKNTVDFNRKHIEKKKKGVPFKVVSTSFLAMTMLGTTVAGNFVNAETAPNVSESGSSSDKNATMPVNVNNSEINKAVKEAEDAGVDVTKDADKSNTVAVDDVPKAQEDIKADYDKQIKDLQAKAKEVEDVKAKNDKAQSDYKAKKKEVKETNDKRIKEYEAKLAKEKEAVSKADNNPKQPKYTAGEGGNYTASGSWTNLASKVLDGDVHVASSGDVNKYSDLQNGNFSIHAYADKKDKITNNNIIQNINWDDVKPKGSGIVEGDQITEDTKKKVPGYEGPVYDTSGEKNPDGKTTQLHSVKAGNWVTIPDAIHLADGSTKDLQVKFDKSGTDLDYGEDWVTFWNEGGAINYYNGTHDINNAPPKDKITATYRVADDTDQKYLWTGATLDIDGGQKLEMSDDNYAILAMGGGLKASGDTIKSVKSDDNLGKDWGKATNSNLLDGTKSVPDGTVVFARYDNKISHSVSNTGVSESTLVANGDFGSRVKTSVAKYPKLEKEPEPPKPESVDVKANYHLNKLNATPSNHKDVEKGVQKEDTKDSIHKGDVNVGDVVTYPLTNSDLPADRKDDIKSYVISDDVPEGVEPNKEKIEKNTDKDKWDVKVEGQKVTYTAKEALLNDMNKDKTKAYKVPTVGLVGTVVKGGDANLDNSFDTIINDSTVESNVVTNTPPKVVKPAVEKSVVDKNDKDINNGEVALDEGYSYKLEHTVPNSEKLESLELYDDLEDVLSLKQDGVKILDENGKDITKEGKLEISEDKSSYKWTANEPIKYAGKKLTTVIDLSLIHI